MVTLRSCRFIFWRGEGLVEGQHYQTLRFNSDLGKHGDTGTSEVEVVRAVLDGRADAGAIGSPFWRKLRSERLVPEGALTEIWTSPPYNHCMFTARPDLEPLLEQRFVEALSGMSYDNPKPPRRARCRGAPPLGVAAPRWVRLPAAGVCATGIL